MSGPQSPPVIAVPGLGEAGPAIAAGLVSAGAAASAGVKAALALAETAAEPGHRAGGGPPR